MQGIFFSNFFLKYVDFMLMNFIQPSNQIIVNEVDKLAEEIVDNVVQRLEADEAMAIDMSRQGINPDAPFPDMTSSSKYAMFSNRYIIVLTIIHILVCILNIAFT